MRFCSLPERILGDAGAVSRNQSRRKATSGGSPRRSLPRPRATQGAALAPALSPVRVRRIGRGYGACRRTHFRHFCQAWAPRRCSARTQRSIPPAPASPAHARHVRPWATQFPPRARAHSGDTAGADAKARTGRPRTEFPAPSGRHRAQPSRPARREYFTLRDEAMPAAKRCRDPFAAGRQSPTPASPRRGQSIKTSSRPARAAGLALGFSSARAVQRTCTCIAHLDRQIDAREAALAGW
jgi:hypothetical protein